MHAVQVVEVTGVFWRVTARDCLARNRDMTQIGKVYDDGGRGRDDCVLYTLS